MVAKKKIYYGWIIALLSALGVGCNFTLLVASTTGIFAGPMGIDMGWTRDTIFFALLFASAPAPVMAPLVGGIVDRYGARSIIAMSFAIQIVILFSFRYLGASPEGLYLRYGLLALLCMGTTNVAFARLICLWFLRRRGLALGIVLAGVGFGGACWSLATHWLIDTYGWRNAYVGIAAIITVLMTPVLLLLRDSPESMGLAIDGDDTAAAATSAALTNAQGMTLGEAGRTQQFWLMIAAFLFIGIGLKAIQDNMVPLLVSRGETQQVAVSAQASLWLAIVAGRVSGGWLLDRYFAPYVAAAYLLPPVVGLCLLVMGSGTSLSFAAAVCVGLAAGCEIDVIAYLVSRYFGVRHYSRIYGVYYATFAIAAFVGPYPAAWISTHLAAGYTSVMWYAAGFLMVGAALMCSFRRYPKVV